MAFSALAIESSAPPPDPETVSEAEKPVSQPVPGNVEANDANEDVGAETGNSEAFPDAKPDDVEALAAPGDLDLALPEIEDHEWSESETANFDGFFRGVFRDAGVDQGGVDKIMGAYAKIVAARDEADRASVVERKETLRKTWGADYGAKINSIRSYLDGMGELGALIKTARTDNGTLLINQPGAAEWLAGLARTKSIDPVRTQQRAEEIRRVLHTDADRYFREKLDIEYEALTAQQGAQPWWDIA